MQLTLKKDVIVGQENTSRIKLKNKLTKRLFPIKIVEGTCLLYTSDAADE
mgnify:CR=1 FL=1